MRLVDSSKEFKVVYSIYNHEYLGCLFSAHVVQLLDNGSLSLSHQVLNAKNMAQFDHALDEVDRKLVRHLDKLGNDEVVRKFGGQIRNVKDFFSKKFSEELKFMVLRYVDRLMLEAIPMLAGKALYVSHRDGYPAKRAVAIREEPAQIRFCFRRFEEETRYFPLVYRNNAKFNICRADATLIVEQPAWLLVGGELFTFAQQVEGKKLFPFLSKPYIAIPKAAEDAYFRKFVPQVIAHYDVDAEGMSIAYIRRDPKFRLLVDASHKDHVSMELRVQYDRFDLKPEPGSPVEVVVEQRAEAYLFFKVFRNVEAERDVVSYLERLQGGIGVLSVGMMGRQAGLQWLSENVQAIVSNGIEVVQDGQVQAITFERPQIVLDPVDAGDWFDIRAVVHIAGFVIPFVKFRKHILQGRREYVLPNGASAILPEEWFAEYRHLLEIAEERDGEVLAIRKYQAMVLDMSWGADSELRERLRQVAQVQDIAEVAAPAGLRAELREYQRQGYNWLGFLKSHHLGGILADDMGLGKTLQTLSLLQHEKEGAAEQASLVVMPTSLIYNWVAEARRFTPDLRVCVHTGPARFTEAGTFRNYDIVLTTYGLVRQDLDMLRQYPWHYLILDESQMIKNPASKTAKAVKELVARHRLSLTGTPVENTLMDLWSQMTFLNPGLLGSEGFFRDFYITPIEKFRDGDRTEKLRKLIHPFILRRTKTQVATELPPKVEQVHYCEMSDAQRKLYDETKNAYRNYLMEMDEGDFSKKKLNILVGLQKLRQIAIHPHLVEEGQELELSESGKFQEYERLLEEVISKGAKVLIFSQFVRLLKLLRGDLEAKGIATCYLDGSTADRQGEVQRFQEDPDVQVFLISLKAGGVGLNLTAAEYVFVLDPWWNPAVERQAVDRTHRIGQQNTVFSYKFITKDTIEEKIILLQQRKFQLSEDVISVEKDLFKQLDMADLVELLG